MLDGDDVTKLSPHERAGRGLCHIAEGRAIFPSLTVHDNIVLFAGRTDPADVLEQAASIFPVLGERMKARAATLSGGQQQMLALVPAFVTSPWVVLVDEPSLGLAPVLVDTIFELLGRLAATGVSMLIVEQYVTERSRSLATHTCSTGVPCVLAAAHPSCRPTPSWPRISVARSHSRPGVFEFAEGTAI